MGVIEAVVTVRMPHSLLEALKDRREKEHFTDVSEQVRSIVRKGCLKYVKPEVKELSQVKENLQKENEDERVRQLLDGLRDLLKRGEQQ